MKEQREKIVTLLLAAAAALAVLCASGGLLYGAGASGGYRPSLYGAIPEHRLQMGGRPAKGKFLVASRAIADPRFRETVILLIRHDRNGAMGLIINRPGTVKLSALFPEVKELEKRADTMFLGGPVGRNEIFMLIRSKGIPEESLYVMKEVYVSSSLTLLKRIAGDSKAKEKFRLYDGYAGWGSGQLEQELLRGDWHILEADAETVFEKDSEKIWQEFILRSSAIEALRNAGIHLFS